MVGLAATTHDEGEQVGMAGSCARLVVGESREWVAGWLFALVRCVRVCACVCVSTESRERADGGSVGGRG